MGGAAYSEEFKTEAPTEPVNTELKFIEELAKTSGCEVKQVADVLMGLKALGYVYYVPTPVTPAAPTDTNVAGSETAPAVTDN